METGFAWSEIDRTTPHPAHSRLPSAKVAYPRQEDRRELEPRFTGLI